MMRVSCVFNSVAGRAGAVQGRGRGAGSGFMRSACSLCVASMLCWLGPLSFLICEFCIIFPAFVWKSRGLEYQRKQQCHEAQAVEEYPQ